MEAFQVKKSVRYELRKRKRQIERRLKNAAPSDDSGHPVLSQQRPRYEIAKRTRAMAHGGIGAAHQVAVQSGLIKGIDDGLELLKLHRPYHESDHVLNIAYNALCGGQTLDDIELRRNDEAYLDALGAAAIPDPTTAGDYCRRFARTDVDQLMEHRRRRLSCTDGRRMQAGDGAVLQWAVGIPSAAGVLGQYW
jgi:hypothetical protein